MQHSGLNRALTDQGSPEIEDRVSRTDGRFEPETDKKVEVTVQKYRIPAVVTPFQEYSMIYYY